ncbi:hypothetical protein ACWEQC_32620 [Streptomyces shenzhenensis]
MSDAFGAYALAVPTPAGSSADEPALVNPDVPAHLVVQALEPSLPECFGCGDREGPWYPDPAGRRYPSGAQLHYCGTCVPDATPEQAAAAVITREMSGEGGSTARDIAAAEVAAGVVFDPRRFQAAVDAAAEQARAETQAELAELREQLAGMAGARRQRDAVLRLCEGRRGDDLLLVSVVAVAAECGNTAVESVPMTLAWIGEVDVPGPGDPARAVIECRSSYGQPAHLVVEGDDRAKLASRVDAEFRDVYEPCPTDGWARLEIAGVGGGLRTYCSPMCVWVVFARAAEELAADDQAAAVDPGQQYPYGDPLAYGPSGIPCGCGKPAHSNLVPCQPDTDDDQGAGGAR